MSLPNGFLDELRSRICLSDVVGRKVQWDLRKSNQARGDMWAPCPFHQEITASFHVDDNIGFISVLVVKLKVMRSVLLKKQRM